MREDTRRGLHGAHLRADLLTSLGRAGLRDELEHGTFIPISRQVLVERHRSRELLTRAAAALLLAGPEAMLTSHTAVRLYGCQAADQAPVHVLVPYSRRLRSRPGIAVHHSVSEACDVERLHGMRTLALEQALAGMLCDRRSSTAFACLEQALAMVPTDQRPMLKGKIAQAVLARRDQRGYRRATTLLELASGLSESPAESWLLLILIDARLPEPVPQFVVAGPDGRERYRLDFAWPDLLVALEYDGYAAHEGREDQDAARDEDLRRRGWLVIRATAADLKAPARLLGALRSAFRERGGA